MDIGHNLSTDSVQQAEPLAPLCVEPHVPVREVLQRMVETGRGAVLVCRQARLEGIFTERDALALLASPTELDVPIERWMTSPPVTLGGADTIAAAVAKMSAKGYRRLPIVDAEGRPNGLLDVAGIVHWLVQHFPAAVYNLPPVPNPATQEREGP